MDARRLPSEGRSADRIRFSSRETELLRLMANSATAPEIAERLYLSVNTGLGLVAANDLVG